MTRFRRFTEIYGPPLPGTAAQSPICLADNADARAFRSAVGGGLFRDGFVSVFSVREPAARLGGWESWLPPGSCAFAGTALGMLLVAAGDRVWMVNTNYGSILETGFTFAEAITRLARKSTRTELLRQPLFEAWRARGGTLPSGSVLAPEPPIPLGGDWSVEALAVVPLAAHLTATAELFDGRHGIPVSIMRDED